MALPHLLKRGGIFEQRPAAEKQHQPGISDRVAVYVPATLGIKNFLGNAHILSRVGAIGKCS